MTTGHLPTEVELVYEVMPCNAMRTSQEPKGVPHPCTYFRQWGTYHSYDYLLDGPPIKPGIIQELKYVGRAPLVPEALSGCRKAPIMAVGINPNLPGWWRANSLNPLFDDYRQYAHYFRYRSVSKLEMPLADYHKYGGGPQDSPFSDFVLNVPPDPDGNRKINGQLQPQAMYQAYQELLEALAEQMGWRGHELIVGEDLSYGNMVACPSARWTTSADPSNPKLPPMTDEGKIGIVTECFHRRAYFLHQLFQSLPPVLLVFSQNTATAFINELHSRFVAGDPQPDDRVEDLMSKEVRLRYGTLADGTVLEARVIFSPHITGNPDDYQRARSHLLEQLTFEARAGNIEYNPITKHLARPRGACVFCTMLEVGPCDYSDELKPISSSISLTSNSPASLLQEEKTAQRTLLGPLSKTDREIETAWTGTNDRREEARANVLGTSL